MYRALSCQLRDDRPPLATLSISGMNRLIILGRECLLKRGMFLYLLGILPITVSSAASNDIENSMCQSADILAFRRKEDRYALI